MKATHILALGALLLAILTGCNEKPAIAGPTCADLNKITDATARAELSKKCPRGGADFKPSEPRKW